MDLKNLLKPDSLRAVLFIIILVIFSFLPLAPVLEPPCIEIPCPAFIMAPFIDPVVWTFGDNLTYFTLAIEIILAYILSCLIASKFKNRPKTFWVIALIFLGFFSFINLMASIMAWSLIFLTYLLISIVALALFVLKKKIGFYLSLAVAIFDIAPESIAIPPLARLTLAIPDEMSLPLLWANTLIPISLGVILLFAAWKSKPIFETKPVFPKP